MSAADGTVAPDSIATRELFPAPFGPMMQTTSFAEGAKLTRSTATIPPYRLVRSCAWNTLSSPTANFQFDGLGARRWPEARHEPWKPFRCAEDQREEKDACDEGPEACAVAANFLLEP